MAWTKRQQIMFFAAARAAGWNPRQRYMAMLHAGCPRRERGEPGGGRTSRPSASDPRNTQHQFELCMAVAESHARARGNGAAMPRPNPGSGPSWSEIAVRRGDRWRRKIDDIATECMERLPAVFSPGFLRGFIARQTMHDAIEMTAFRPRVCGDGALSDLDEGQLYRVLEGLRAWAGREFLRHDLRPRSFEIPAGARRRLFGSPLATSTP